MERLGYITIFLQVLKLFQMVYFNDISMAFRCTLRVTDTASVNSFCIISVLVLVSVLVPDAATVIRPLCHTKDSFVKYS